MKYATPLAALAALLAGAVLRMRGAESAADTVWLVGLAITGLPVVARTVAGLLRGQFAADVVATLSIVGALLLGYPVAGLVIVLMQSGGEALEHYAAGRASAAVRHLEAMAPRLAHRVRDGSISIACSMSATSRSLAFTRDVARALMAGTISATVRVRTAGRRAS